VKAWGLRNIRHTEEMDAGTAQELRDLAGRTDRAEAAACFARDDAAQLARQLQKARQSATAATGALVTLLRIHSPRGIEAKPTCARCGERWPCGVWSLAAPGVDLGTQAAVLAERQEQRQQRGLRPLEIGGTS
jgi:hypothetical protein